MQRSRGEVRENQMRIQENAPLNKAYITASRECALSDINVWFASFLVDSPFEVNNETLSGCSNSEMATMGNGGRQVIFWNRPT